MVFRSIGGGEKEEVEDEDQDGLNVVSGDERNT